MEYVHAGQHLYVQNWLIYIKSLCRKVFQHKYKLVQLSFGERDYDTFREECNKNKSNQSFCMNQQGNYSSYQTTNKGQQNSLQNKGRARQKGEVNSKLLIPN